MLHHFLNIYILLINHLKDWKVEILNIYLVYWRNFEDGNMLQIVIINVIINKLNYQMYLNLKNMASFHKQIRLWMRTMIDNQFVDVFKINQHIKYINLLTY